MNTPQFGKEGRTLKAHVVRAPSTPAPSSKQKALAAALGNDKRTPLTLNPSEAGQFKETAAEHKLAVAQGQRKRRNDALFTLLSQAGARSPLGETR